MDKLGFLETIVYFSLKRPELKDDFITFLKSKDNYVKELSIIEDTKLDNMIKN